MARSQLSVHMHGPEWRNATSRKRQLNGCWKHYSIRRPASKKGSPAEILEGDYQGRVLKLWVKRDSDPPFIKTVAWKDE